jgi:hypothetical protein
VRTFIPVFIILIIAIAASRRRKRRQSDAPTQTVAGMGKVSIDDIGVTHCRAGGTVEELKWDELHDIHIETVAGGLSAADVRWVLSSESGTSVRLAQTAPGADLLIARLQQLPGFRYEPMIQSMITTEATRFVVWERALA